MPKTLIKRKSVWFCGAIVLLIATFHFATNRTVTWEEELPLNTGETIWVKRSVPWTLQGGAGNPFDIAIRGNPDQQIIEFSYREKAYRYNLGAAVRWILIDKRGRPTLVATAADWAWADRNSYLCVAPLHVQFIPDDSGTQWHWPERIESWLYGSPYNLMAMRPRLEEQKKARYTVAERLERDTTVRIQNPPAVVIDPTYKASCSVAFRPFSGK